MTLSPYVRTQLLLVAFCGLFLLAPVANRAAADEAKPEGDKPQAKITYEEHVQPIFRQHCFTCHGPDTAKSDLRLDNYAAMMRGGAGGAVIEPGDIESSRLWKLVSHEEAPEMPPQQDKLPEATLATLKQWITSGALETAGSTAKVKAKRKVEMKLTVGAGKPEGPPPMPEGLSKQPSVYTARAAAVTALASSPWAPLLAVAGQKQITLYNTDTAQLLGVLPFPEGIPQVLRFSRSGALLLAAGGRDGQSGRVVLFDVRTGQRVTEIGDELDTVTAADINDDHTQVALGGPRRIVKIYNVADGALLHEIRKHTDWITAIEYSPDGVLLATADRNGGMFVWEAETAREYQNLKGHTAAIAGVSWRIDGNLLASTSEDTTIKLWEMEAGQQVKNWAAHPGGSTAVNFSMDGRLVSSGRDKTVKLWDQNGAQQRAFDAFGDIALRATFTHDGGRVVGGDWTGEIRLWNAADGVLLGRLASNPPTLAMVAEAETARAAAAKAAVEKAQAELAALQKDSAEKTGAATALAEQLKAVQAALEKANADKAAAEKLLAEKTAAAQAAAEAATAAASAAAKAAEEKAAYDKTQTAQASAAN
jgi:hypothetical protein